MWAATWADRLPRCPAASASRWRLPPPCCSARPARFLTSPLRRWPCARRMACSTRSRPLRRPGRRSSSSPTTSITPCWWAVRGWGGVVEEMRGGGGAGQAVIFITHNFHHALLVGDEVVVLGNGKVMAHFNTGETSLEELTRLVSMLH